MKDSFILYNSFYDPLKGLSDQDKARLFDAIFCYHIRGEVPDMSPVCQMAFNFMKGQFDRDSEKYLSTIVERNRRNGARGGRPPKDTYNPNDPQKPTGFPINPENPDEPKKADNVDVDVDVDVEKEKIKKKSKSFSAPSLSEIESFFAAKITEKGLSLNAKIEAEKFESFYSSKNWMVGKNKMADWEKAVSGWIARTPGNGKPQPKQFTPKYAEI